MWKCCPSSSRGKVYRVIRIAITTHPRSERPLLGCEWGGRFKLFKVPTMMEIGWSGFNTENGSDLNIDFPDLPKRPKGALVLWFLFSSSTDSATPTVITEIEQSGGCSGWVKLWFCDSKIFQALFRPVYCNIAECLHRKCDFTSVFRSRIISLYTARSTIQTTRRIV